MRRRDRDQIAALCKVTPRVSGVGHGLRRRRIEPGRLRDRRANLHENDAREPFGERLASPHCFFKALLIARSSRGDVIAVPLSDK